MGKKRFQTNSNSEEKIRYAVVGLGHIAQAAVLPAFQNAQANSELVALVSDDKEKLKTLSRKYRIEHCFSYEQYDQCLNSGEIDAVYIALPNDMHYEFTVKAAKAGVHVLCEKPLAVTESECQKMIKVCEDNQVKLMTAYRLHFDDANLEAIKILNSGKIGEPRIFNSLFSFQASEGNIRLQKEKGGGTVYDIGTYCINAARYLFQSEPLEVTAFTFNNGEKRFREVDEMTSAIMRFPNDRSASFTTSFGVTNIAQFEVIGTKGRLKMSNVYSYSSEVEMELTINGKTQTKKFPKTDQFAPELIYFSDCILRDKEPEPSGKEGLIDVHIIQSIYESASKGRPIKLKQITRNRRPTLRQEIRRPSIREPKEIKAESPKAK